MDTQPPTFNFDRVCIRLCRRLSGSKPHEPSGANRHADLNPRLQTRLKTNRSKLRERRREEGLRSLFPLFPSVEPSPALCPCPPSAVTVLPESRRVSCSTKANRRTDFKSGPPMLALGQSFAVPGSCGQARPACRRTFMSSSSPPLKPASSMEPGSGTSLMML